MASPAEPSAQTTPYLPAAVRGEGFGRPVAVVLAQSGSARRRVVAALQNEGWNVGRTAPEKAKVADAVVVVDPFDADAVARTVSDARPLGARVVVVAAEPRAETVRELLDAGADAVVFGSSLDAHLGAALAAVRAGLVVAPREVRQAIERPALTPREKQALGMVVLGFSNADIARKLFVAESTVKSHLSSAFSKLGVRTRSEAAARILDSSQGFGTGILAIVGDGDAGAA